jgi:penicillin-binding protein 1A
MQVARNFFLTREKTPTRKLNEILLSYKIEANLSKDQILELYMNQINLGRHAYGFGAASQIYFGKTLKDINLAEAAMLATLPQAPSRNNPVANPERAKQRQQYVLRRMREVNFITDAQYKEAVEHPLHIQREIKSSLAHADYVAEMARQVVFDTYGEDAYGKGIKVYTTLRMKDQESAYEAVRKGVIDYDHRHGYRGPESFVNLPAEKDAQEEAIDDVFQDLPEYEDLRGAVVLDASPKSVRAVLADGTSIEIAGDGLKFVQKALADKAPPNVRIRRGAVIRVQQDDKGNWQLTQMPLAEAGFISVNPVDGAIYSLIGGFDFYRNKYNHVTQAIRQPGSSFKPFIYSAALEKGFSPATVVNDAPLYFDASQTGSQPWEPKNYDGKFEGPMRLRTALMKSKNLVTIRVLQSIGAQYAQDYITRFGFDPKLHPAYLTMALGAGGATPLQMAVAYSVFANGGYRVSPYLIDKIVDSRGTVLSEAKRVPAGEGAERVIDARNAFVMTTLMRDVVRAGTAAKAMSLGRKDLAGKTGTTNDNVDAWFAGFNADLVGIAWIGHDQPKSLGAMETGGVAALPIWMSYMGKVLKGVPETPLAVPDGVVVAHINPDSGLREGETRPGIPEYFYQEYAPKESPESFAASPATSTAGRPADVRNQLF